MRWPTVLKVSLIGTNWLASYVLKLRPQDVIEPLGLAHYSLQEAYPLAFEVLTTLHRFLTSSVNPSMPRCV